MAAAIHQVIQTGSPLATRNRLFHFLMELRRRRVCRAITMYSVAIWLVCQVVDVISPALELPEWTLRLVIVFGLLGMPLIVITSWLFEMTPDGLVPEVKGDMDDEYREGSRAKQIADRLIDCSLLFAAVAIGFQLATAGAGNEVEPAVEPVPRISVMPFRLASGEEAAGFSEGLAVELQHTLKEQFGITVLASSDPAQLKGSMKLTGAVSASDTMIRVAVTLIDFDSGVVVWSAAFQQPRDESSAPSTEIAKRIAAALPMPDDELEQVRFANVVR